MTEHQSKKKRRVSMCVGCGSEIRDQYILRVAPDLEWHASCLKCADCHTFLDETSTCFVRDGKTYCKQDYVRLFGTKCAKCSHGFSKNDFVMRARSKIYHVDCFRCVACSRQLVPGDEFALRDDSLYCKVDNDVLERATITTQTLHTGITSQKNSPSAQTNGGTVQNDSGNGNIISDTNGNPNSNSCSNNNSSSKGRKPEKTTRVRTVLNEKQLHTLRTCYAANPRPDAVMKEQLVEMTGLSPRVIRVWFQNKRCKDKKRSILMKNQIQAQQQAVQQDVQNHNCSVVVTNSPLPPRSVPQSSMSAISGVPMLGNSPVHAPPTPHDMVPPEVGGYQPWKALSDFAMQAEIEQQPFQQLVHFSEQANVGGDSIVSSATN